MSLIGEWQVNVGNILKEIVWDNAEGKRESVSGLHIAKVVKVTEEMIYVDVYYQVSITPRSQYRLSEKAKPIPRKSIIFIEDSMSDKSIAGARRRLNPLGRMGNLD